MGEMLTYVNGEVRREEGGYATVAAHELFIVGAVVLTHIVNLINLLPAYLLCSLPWP
jgi:hypothetical protein